MALPKSHRLSLRQQRDRITQTGKTSYGKYFTLVSAESSQKTSSAVPRFAILLSKKTAALAVDRNRIKRITSSILEKYLSSSTPKDYLVIPKRQVLIEKYQTLEDDLKNLLTS